MTIVPAYGRDYKSRAAVEADWKADKDFQIAGYDPDSGRYINLSDARSTGVRQVTIRYDRLRKLTIVSVPDK